MPSSYTLTSGFPYKYSYKPFKTSTFNKDLIEKNYRNITFLSSVKCSVQHEKYKIGKMYLLVGKRVETIQKQWQQIFIDAAWHQPSVILFDDLDQVISAPSALQEMGGEALYKCRLAQGEMH